jgi:peptidoglycan/LPS O-acetylase OafA/YrhL
VLQQKTGWELRETIDFDGPSVDMIVIGHHIFWNDLLALGYLAVVCWVASRTYRYIEDPARRFFGRLARRRRPQLAAPAAA